MSSHWITVTAPNGDQLRVDTKCRKSRPCKHTGQEKLSNSSKWTKVGCSGYGVYNWCNKRNASLPQHFKYMESLMKNKIKPVKN